MLLFALLAIQTAAALAAGVYLWRRQERQSAEIARLREALAAVEQAQVAKSRTRRAAAGGVVPLTVTAETASAEAHPLERAHRAWNLTDAPKVTLPTPGVSAETARGLALGILAIAPALGFAFGAS